MSTLTKPRAKKPVRKAAPTARKVLLADLDYGPRRTPPPCTFTAADLLKRKDFGEGLNADLVEAAVADRAH